MQGKPFIGSKFGDIFFKISEYKDDYIYACRYDPKDIIRIMGLPDIQYHIYKFTDDWYFVPIQVYTQHRNIKYVYKCDTLDGVLQLLLIYKKIFDMANIDLRAIENEIENEMGEYGEDGEYYEYEEEDDLDEDDEYYNDEEEDDLDEEDE